MASKAGATEDASRVAAAQAREALDAAERRARDAEAAVARLEAEAEVVRSQRADAVARVGEAVGSRGYAYMHMWVHAGRLVLSERLLGAQHRSSTGAMLHKRGGRQGGCHQSIATETAHSCRCRRMLQRGVRRRPVRASMTWSMCTLSCR